MNRLTILKLVLLAVGLVVFGYGMKTDDARVRLFGIVFLAAGFALRLVPKRGEPE